MKNCALFASSALTFALFCTEGARAATLVSLPGPTREFTSGIDPNHAPDDPNLVPNTFDMGFTSTGGPGATTFRLDAHGSIDGLNATTDGDEDDFTLSLNGVAILSGTWNLSGGGGDSFTALDPSATAVAVGSIVFGRGGTVDISTPLGLKAGSNTLDFAFTTRKPLGLGDEGWDIRTLTVTGPGVDVVAGAVPEPGAWALMLLGFFGLGGALRQARARRDTKMTPVSLLRASPIRA